MLSADAEKMSTHISNSLKTNTKLDEVKNYAIMSKLSSAIQRVFDLDNSRNDIRDAFASNNMTEEQYKKALKRLLTSKTLIKEEIIEIGTQYESILE
jgi:hypothetical protein